MITIKKFIDLGLVVHVEYAFVPIGAQQKKICICIYERLCLHGHIYLHKEAHVERGSLKVAIQIDVTCVWPPSYFFFFFALKP